MSMEDWAKRLDGFLEFNGNEILTEAGKISAEKAKLRAETLIPGGLAGLEMLVVILQTVVCLDWIFGVTVK